MSEFIWKSLPISFIQFPFRFLALEMLAAAFISAILIEIVHTKKMALIFSGVIGVIVFLPVLTFLSKINYIDRADGYYATNEDTTTVKKEYMPVWVKKQIFSRPANKIESENATISNQMVESNKFSFISSSSKPSQVTINTIYFPGWFAKIDKKNAIISQDNPSGVITLSVPAGEHHINVYFSETPERLASDIVSLISLFFLGLWVRRKYHYGKV